LAAKEIEGKMTPTWLPALIDTDGNWDDVLLRLFKVFENDFIKNKFQYSSKPLIWDSRILEGKYPEGFWHVTTREDFYTKERLPDFPRAKRLPWCKPTILNSNDPEVRLWENREDGKNKVYIWLETLDYVVILHRKVKLYFLLTAYHVDGDGSRRSLRKKYNRRIT
jgi:hypothetical protein